MRLAAALAALTVLAGCAADGPIGAVLAEGATANSCRTPGPHDAASPGQMVCDSPDGSTETRPADRAN
jgi:hypothetical protein